MDSEIQDINNGVHVRVKEERFENDPSNVENIDYTHCFESIDSNVKIENVYNSKQLENELLNNQSYDSLHRDSDVGLQIINQQVKVEKEWFENDRMIFESVPSTYGVETGNSGFEKGAKLINLKQEVEVTNSKHESSEFNNVIESTCGDTSNEKSEWNLEKRNSLICRDSFNITVNCLDIGDSSSVMGNAVKIEIPRLNIIDKSSIKPEDKDLKIEKVYSKDEAMDLMNEKTGHFDSGVGIRRLNMDTDFQLVARLTKQETVFNQDLEKDICHPEKRVCAVIYQQHDLSRDESHNEISGIMDKHVMDDSKLKCVSFIRSPKIDRPHKCSQCDKRFWIRSELRNHMKSHGTERPHECSQCDKRFKTASNLREHMVCHNTDRPYACDQCDKKFKTVWVLRKHIVTHSIDRPHKCNQCYKRFKTESSLREHMKWHTTDRPHNCDQCDKTFKTVQLLRKHMVSHSTDRPHKCDQCDKRFKIVRHLKAHMIGHSTDRPYKCNLCPGDFKVKSSLKSHMISHKTWPSYICSVCNKGFKRLRGFRSHLLCHRPQKCSVCQKDFQDLQSFKEHRICSVVSHDDNIGESPSLNTPRKSPNSATI